LDKYSIKIGNVLRANREEEEGGSTNYVSI
jgi:hypothetical protein